MPVRARCAMRREAKRTCSQERLRSQRRERCPCSNLQSKPLQQKALASTRSSFSSTTGMSWGFIRGSSCGNGARARSARRRGPAMLVRNTKMRWLRFLGATILGYLQHPATVLSIDRHDFQSSYFCREAIPAFASHRTCVRRTDRGPDGIRIRICYRRMGPQTIYSCL